MYKIIGADQKEYGPITGEQVRQWIAEGRLNAISKIQVEGSGEWKLLRDLPEFSPLLPPPPAISLQPAKAIPATNPLATTSLILGIISVIPCCGVILAPVSIVLGAIALSELKKNPNQGGRGMAIGGIVLGGVGLLVNATLFLIPILFPGTLMDLQNQLPH